MKAQVKIKIEIDGAPLIEIERKADLRDGGRWRRYRLIRQIERFLGDATENFGNASKGKVEDLIRESVDAILPDLIRQKEAKK